MVSKVPKLQTMKLVVSGWSYSYGLLQMSKEEGLFTQACLKISCFSAGMRAKTSSPGAEHQMLRMEQTLRIRATTIKHTKGVAA